MSTDLRLVVPGPPQFQSRASLAQQLTKLAEQAITTLLRWQELAHERRALLRLDDHMLKDIGLTRADAMREGERPFWDQGSESCQIWP